MSEDQFAQVEPPTELWRKYCEGKIDAAGRKIDTIFAHDDTFVIYTTVEKDDESEVGGPPVLHYHIEGNDDARSHLAEANVLVAQIHSLAPRKSRYRVVIDKQLAAAYELALRNRIDSCKTILLDVLAQLQGTQTAKGQLRYMTTNVIGCAFAWLGYSVWHHEIHSRSPMDPAGPWVLAGALGTLGGVLSVAINLKSVEINVHQHWFLQCFAGWTRNVVAFVGGVACLLAIRSKMALASFITTDVSNLFISGLVLSEAFFCFIAGFSESFVPNILRDSEKAAANKTTTASARNAALNEKNEALKPPIGAESSSNAASAAKRSEVESEKSAPKAALRSNQS